MHGAKNYPFHKLKSDLDIPLEDGTGDDEYLEKLTSILPGIIDEVNQILFFIYWGGYFKRRQTR